MDLEPNESLELLGAIIFIINFQKIVEYDIILTSSDLTLAVLFSFFSVGDREISQ